MSASDHETSMEVELVEPLPESQKNGGRSEIDQPLVTHAFSTPSEESRICWRLGLFSAIFAPVTFVASWAERARLFEGYEWGGLQFVFVVFGFVLLLAIFASFGAILTGLAELTLWLFHRKQQPTCWRTLAGIGLACLLPLSILPSSTVSTPSALRSADMNSLRQLAFANLNYECVHNYFPPSSGKNESPASIGKGLSWRVHLLPYLEHTELYQRFRMDEPWDSPHNLALLPEMPEDYASRWPLDAVPVGHTLFQRPVGHGAIDAGDGKGIRIDEISDGASSTILIVQVDPDHAVPWTKPADYIFDPADPQRGLGHAVRYPAWLGVRCDGAVFSSGRIKANRDEFCAMFTRDAGDEPPEDW